MLLRENKSNLALNQIDEALKLNRNARVLHHTKGHILSDLALNCDSIEIGRKRLHQSEDSFTTALQMDKRDEYSYQGLAELYLGWAKFISKTSLSEELDYIKKAEDIVNTGLKLVKMTDALWIESANIRSYLGNQPSRLEALEKAIQAYPSSTIARYLLGRAYRHEKKYDKAIQILKPVIENYHEEFRCFVEYALSLIFLSRPYKESIAILNLSTLYGYSSPKFIAILGGLYLLDKQPAESERVFFESRKRDYNGADQYRIFFKPPDPLDTNRHLRFSGTVKQIKAGYSIIQTDEYLDFVCPGVKYGKTIMKEGQEITFEPVFTAKGRIAEHPETKQPAYR
jgi:tetratricopeptide (TPR) repeat protein